MNTSFYLAYSIVVVCYVDKFSDMDGSIYLDPHDHGRNLEHHFQLTIESSIKRRKINMRTWTWDLGLWMRFLY
jgi:hypothetical protein